VRTVWRFGGPGGERPEGWDQDLAGGGDGGMSGTGTGFVRVSRVGWNGGGGGRVDGFGGSAMHRAIHGVEGPRVRMANRYWGELNADERRYVDAERGRVPGAGIAATPRLGRSVREWDWVRLGY